MSKTTLQLTQTTTSKTGDNIAMVDVANSQDKRMTKADWHSSKPQGELYVSANNTLPTVITVQGTLVEITNSTLVTVAGILKDFTHDPATGKLTYTGEEDITVMINVSASIQKVGASAVADGVRLQLVNTTVAEVKGNQYGRAQGTGTNIENGNIPITMIQNISNGDYFTLQIANETGTTNFYVYSLNLNIVAL